MWELSFRFARGRIPSAKSRIFQMINSFAYRNTKSLSYSDGPTKPIQEMLRNLILLLESKTFEIDNIFAKTSKQMNDTFEKSKKAIAEEIDVAEKALSDAVKKAGDHGNLVKKCTSSQQDDVKIVRSKLNEALKICNEQAMKALDKYRSENEGVLEEVRAWKMQLKKVMKDCLANKTDLNKCLSELSAQSVERYRVILTELDKIPKVADNSILEILKTSAKCHAEAQFEAAKVMKKIVADTKICVDNSLADKGKSESPTKQIASESLESSIGILQSKVAQFKEVVKNADKGLPDENTRTCIGKAIMDTKVAIDILQHELAECTKFAIIALRPFASSPEVKETFEKAGLIVKDLQEIVKICIGKEREIFKCCAEKLISMRDREVEMTKKIQMMVLEAKLPTADSDKVTQCYEKCVGRAQLKLIEIEKMFNECTSKSKN